MKRVARLVTQSDGKGGTTVVYGMCTDDCKFELVPHSVYEVQLIGEDLVLKHIGPSATRETTKKQQLKYDTNAFFTQQEVQQLRNMEIE